MDDEKDFPAVETSKDGFNYADREKVAKFVDSALATTNVLRVAMKNFRVWDLQEKHNIRDYAEMCNRISILIHRSLQEIAWLTSEGKEQ